MEYDITAKIGCLFPIHTELKPPEWPMYSFSRPATMLWDTIYNRLRERGMTEQEAKEWLQSKSPRWALDDSLGDAIIKIANEYVDNMYKS